LKTLFAPCDPVLIPVTGGETLFPVHRVYCVARNYADHALEMGGSPDREPPFFFSKPADSVVTHPTIPFPSRTSDLHHEVELVVALNGGGRDLLPEEARNIVFGYAVGVDLTRRDLQAAAKKQGRPWDVAKGFDFSAPVSEIVAASQCGHPESGMISLSVNQRVRQSGDLSQMIWSVNEVIAELSGYYELKPGDLIFTGTPAGVSSLQPGDHIEGTIEGVGRLQFTLDE